MSFASKQYKDKGFNSRTPGGVRRKHQSLGADDAGFNSRTPGGVRPDRYLMTSRAVLFQFTHPGRGATDGFFRLRPFTAVSIHAPREGCDGLHTSR